MKSIEAGSLVRVVSKRPNREQFFGATGKVLSRIGKRRDVLYVRIESADCAPPFFEEELEFLGNANTNTNTGEVA